MAIRSHGENIAFLVRGGGLAAMLASLWKRVSTISKRPPVSGSPEFVSIGSLVGCIDSFLACDSERADSGDGKEAETRDPESRDEEDDALKFSPSSLHVERALFLL